MSSITAKRRTAALLSGICVGVRMGAHEPTVHCTKKQNFFGFHVHVCVCACVVDLTYVRCLHMFGCLSHCVMRESFFF